MKYTVSATLTISIHTEVEADSEAEALEEARNRPLVALPFMDMDPEAEWCHSGELDGEPQDVEVDKS